MPFEVFAFNTFENLTFHSLIMTLLILNSRALTLAQSLNEVWYSYMRKTRHLHFVSLKWGSVLKGKDLLPSSWKQMS